MTPRHLRLRALTSALTGGGGRCRAAALAACSLVGDEPTTRPTPASKDVVLVTHDSFVLPEGR